MVQPIQKWKTCPSVGSSSMPTLIGTFHMHVFTHDQRALFVIGCETFRSAGCSVASALHVLPAKPFSYIWIVDTCRRFEGFYFQLKKYFFTMKMNCCQLKHTENKCHTHTHTNSPNINIVLKHFTQKINCVSFIAANGTNWERSTSDGNCFSNCINSSFWSPTTEKSVPKELSNLNFFGLHQKVLKWFYVFDTFWSYCSSNTCVHTRLDLTRFAASKNRCDFEQKLYVADRNRVCNSFHGELLVCQWERVLCLKLYSTPNI